MRIVSNLLNVTPCPIPTVKDLEFCQSVYMCVRDPKFADGQLLIPDNYQSVIIPLIAVLLSDVEADDYIYVTISKKHVQPNSSGNRSGWHVDGFLSDDRSYIWFDRLPTQAAYGVFDVDADHERSLKQFADQVQYQMIADLPTETLIELGDAVHAPVCNLNVDTVVRTFIKIVLSKEQFNGVGNAWNYKIPHIKPNKVRGALRNHTVL